VTRVVYQLFVEANQPLPPMGIKQRSAKLSPRQRQVCASEAAAVLAACKAPWPADFDAAVRRYWQQELDWQE